MAGKNTAVFGIYRDTTTLARGLEQLRSAGFRSTDISVLMPENKSNKEFAHKKALDVDAERWKHNALGAVGGIAGSLIGMGVPEYEAKRYEGRVKSGGILLSVHCDESDWGKRAKTILEQSGAEDVAEAREARADYAVSDRPGSRI